MERINQLMEEYEILRAEILYYMNKDTTLMTCLFSGVTTVLFFSIKENIVEGCLLAYLIIIPICSKFAYHQKQIAKLATYISVFLESELEVKWETRLREISKEKDKSKLGNVFKFSECPMMACATIFSYTYLVVKNRILEKSKFIFCIETILMLILFLVVLLFSSEIYQIKCYRCVYFNKMKMIKEKERKNDGTD